jgi:hypothetical protein
MLLWNISVKLFFCETARPTLATEDTIRSDSRIRDFHIRFPGYPDASLRYVDDGNVYHANDSKHRNEPPEPVAGQPRALHEAHPAGVAPVIRSLYWPGIFGADGVDSSLQ